MAGSHKWALGTPAICMVQALNECSALFCLSYAEIVHSSLVMPSRFHLSGTAWCSDVLLAGCQQCRSSHYIAGMSSAKMKKYESCFQWVKRDAFHTQDVYASLCILSKTDLMQVMGSIFFFCKTSVTSDLSRLVCIWVRALVWSQTVKQTALRITD